MSTSQSQETLKGGPSPGRGALPEDWLATAIGLAIVAVIGLGLLGPGPQRVTLQAAAGETATARALAIGGWQASATLDGERISTPALPTVLERGAVNRYRCVNGLLEGEVFLDTELALHNDARIELDNQCDAAVIITYRTQPAIPWPLLNLFGG